MLEFLIVTDNLVACIIILILFNNSNDNNKIFFYSANILYVQKCLTRTIKL